MLIIVIMSGNECIDASHVRSVSREVVGGQSTELVLCFVKNIAGFKVACSSFKLVGPISLSLWPSGMYVVAKYYHMTSHDVVELNNKLPCPTTRQAARQRSSSTWLISNLACYSKQPFYDSICLSLWGKISTLLIIEIISNAQPPMPATHIIITSSWLYVQ